MACCTPWITSRSNDVRSTLHALTRPPTPGVLKWILGALGLGGSALMLTELLLIRHHNQPLQIVAPIAAAIGVSISLVPALTQNRAARVLSLIIALGLMFAGGIGGVVHLWRNAEVTNSRAPLEVLSGPFPALAPLALANIGAVIALTVWVTTRQENT
jgi:hypothetical protein